MRERASIALACPEAGERTAVEKWLSQSGYDPVALPDLSRLDDNLQAAPIEALIADVALVPRQDDLRGLVRRLGNNRPLVVVGDASRLPRAMLGELSVIARPLTRESVLLSVGLALAEGRPARRFPRRPVEPIPALAHGVAVTVREASVGGVGIELAAPRQSVLPPFFSLRIPSFGVHVLVKRAWMAADSSEVMRCGGTVEGDLPGATRSWSEFAAEAPVPVSSVTRRWEVS
jgi:hypothetical protein